MGSYYYLISGLPEVKLSDAKAKYDINEITQSILSSLILMKLLKAYYLV